MVLGRFPVVVGRVLVVLGGLGVVVRCFFRHESVLSLEGFRIASWNLMALW
jgi:hypothetical protein